MLWYPHKKISSNYDINWHFNFGHHMLTTISYLPHTTLFPTNATCPMPPALHLPVSIICNSASLWIRYAETYMIAYHDVSFDVSCFRRMFLEAYSIVDWKCAIVWIGSVKRRGSSILGRSIGNVLKSSFGCIMRDGLGSWNQEDWEWAIKLIWLRTSEQFWPYTWAHTMRSTLNHMCRCTCEYMQLCSWDYPSEIGRKHKVILVTRVPTSIIWSMLLRMLCSLPHRNREVHWEA